VNVTATLHLTDGQLDEIARRAVMILDDRDNGDGWLTTAQASEAWGIEQAAVRAKARRGTVESRKEGRTVLVRRPKVTP
jgi:hypothetical protein